MRTNDAGQSTLLLFDAVKILTEQGIGYAVIGALAASVHGVIHASVDIDAVLSLTVQDAANLEKNSRWRDSTPIFDVVTSTIRFPHCWL